MLPQLPASLEWVFLDVGDTMAYLDVDAIAQHVASLGIAVTGAALRDAQARVRPRIDEAVLQLHAAHEDNPSERLHEGEEGFLRFIGAILREAAPETDSPTRRKAAQSLRNARDGEGWWTRLDPHLTDTLDRLKAAGLQLGVISNAEGTVEQHLENVGVRPYFEVVIDSTVVGVEKPDPRIFEIALERTGAHPGASVYVGDFYSFDIIGSAGLGIAGILIDPSTHYRANYPDVTAISAFRELPDVLRIG